MKTLIRQVLPMVFIGLLLHGCGSGTTSDQETGDKIVSEDVEAGDDSSGDDSSGDDSSGDDSSDDSSSNNNEGQDDEEPQQSARKTTSMGMGLAGIADWTTQYPFLDFVKISRQLFDTVTGNDIPEEQMDENGWLSRIEDGQLPGFIFLTNDEDGGPIDYDQFVVRWEGTGEVSYHWAARQTGTAHGGDLVSAGPGSSMLRIDSSDPEDPIRNITVVPAQHVDAFDQGEVFNPDWIERMSDFRAVRFMDWMDTNNSEQETWADRPAPNDRSYAKKGVPVEVMVQLANKLNADPWFNMPHRADLDYMRRFAQIVRDQLNPNLLAYVEHSNEVWNWGFWQTHYAFEQGQARWGEATDGPHMQWHGMRTAQMCDVWKEEVFADEAGRVHCVFGTQGGWHGLETSALNCPGWVGEGNLPCYQHGFDSVAITGYFSGCLYGASGWGGDDQVDEIRSWFDDPDGGIQRGLEQLVDGRHFECDDNLQGLRTTYEYFNNVASNLGLEVVAYEGGQHITGNGHPIQEDQDFINFHIAINRAEGMKQVYADNFEMWRESGGTLFMHFVDFARPSKWGSWGALEHLGQDTSPRWEAITEFNSDVPCWWNGCSGQ